MRFLAPLEMTVLDSFCSDTNYNMIFNRFLVNLCVFESWWQKNPATKALRNTKLKKSAIIKFSISKYQNEIERG